MSEAEPKAWSDRYEVADIPWDLGVAHPELIRRLAEDPGLGFGPGSALVPGCGLGHDAIALSEVGWQVTAIDFAPAVARPVAEALTPLGGRFVLGDALDYAGTVDLWLDHTFYCALPPERRPDYGSVANKVVRPGGRLISIVFPLARDLSEGGPPYGMTTEELGASLGSAFALVMDEPALQPPGRSWSHRWCVFERV